MSDKKRKAVSQESGRPQKKSQVAGTIRVRHLSSSGIAKPTIASCPGSSLPPNLNFTTYATKHEPQLLLHSSDHDTIDFTAVETRTTSAIDAHMKHYVAVFDPATSQLTVTEAKKVAARTQVRQFETEQEEDSEQDVAPTPRNASRAALTEAFGTKKSRKAAQSIAENRLLARGGNSGDGPVSAAIQSSVQEGDDDDLLASQQDTIQSNKPLPPANLDTDDIREVYSLSTIVLPAGQTTLQSLSVAAWKDRFARGKPSTSRSHFVSNRLQPLLQLHSQESSTNTTDGGSLMDTQILALRYLEFLILLYQRLSSFNNRRTIPPVHTWDSGDLSPLTSILPLPSIKTHLHHFLPDRIPTTFAMTLLRTTILALALHIPPAGSTPANNTLIVEPTDISRDLAKDTDEIMKLYRELGCKSGSMSDTDVKVWGLERLKGRRSDDTGEVQKAPRIRVAKLKFPVEFPKLSMGRRTRR